jgi:putative SOS response-associated peptidase YedK
MFNRYTITALPSSIEIKFKAKIPELYKPNFNASHDQFLPVIRNDRTGQVTMATWGIDSGIIKGDQIGTILYVMDIDYFKTKENLQYFLHQHRFLVLADGFSLWKSVSRKSSVPYRVVSNTDKIFCFCGICVELGANRFCFLILTRESYKPVNKLADQMPVILSPPDELKWLQKGLPLNHILDQAEIEDWALLNYYPVSPRIRDPNINSPSLIRNFPTTDQHGNLYLFD